jgi:hypothetical protein
MIHHVLRFKWHEGVAQDQIDEALRLLRELAEVDDSIVGSMVGQDIGDPADGYTHGLCYTLRDDGYRSYMNSPHHRKVDDFVLPLSEKIASYELTDNMDPDMRSKMVAIQSQRNASDPGIVDLQSGVKELRNVVGGWLR